MNYSLNAGYGRIMAEKIGLGGTVGKTFIVGKSAIAYRYMYQQIFKNDEDGVVRFVSTVAAAVALCTANSGDRIFVLPGHAETFSSATALNINVVGVNIIGLGTGSNRPTFTLDTGTTTTITISAANVSFQNCIFVANFAAIASLFTLTTASDFLLSGCEFRDTSSILNFVAIVTSDTTTHDADGLTITLCKRIGAGADTNTTIVSMLGTNDRLVISSNYFTHNAVTAGGLMIIATGKIVTNADINSNLINLLGASSSTSGIIITTNGTTNSGVLRSNMIQSLDQTTEILVTATSGFIFMNNFYSGTADKSGYLLPAADS